MTEDERIDKPLAELRLTGDKKSILETLNDLEPMLGPERFKELIATVDSVEDDFHGITITLANKSELETVFARLGIKRNSASLTKPQIETLKQQHDNFDSQP